VFSRPGASETPTTHEFVQIFNASALAACQALCFASDWIGLSSACLHVSEQEADTAQSWHTVPPLSLPWHGLLLLLGETPAEFGAGGGGLFGLGFFF
jgi:hypothetical protein